MRFIEEIEQVRSRLAQVRGQSLLHQAAHIMASLLHRQTPFVITYDDFIAAAEGHYGLGGSDLVPTMRRDLEVVLDNLPTEIRPLRRSFLLSRSVEGVTALHSVLDMQGVAVVFTAQCDSLTVLALMQREMQIHKQALDLDSGICVAIDDPETRTTMIATSLACHLLMQRW